MNSREKQRKAMHASNGLVAKVRQLPTYMKVINVVLALVLAFGVGQNWAYAAELIPEGVQDTFTLTESNTQATLYAPETSGADSYQWQLKDQSTTDEYIDLAGENESSLTVTSGLLADNLDANEEAALKVLVKDADGNELTSKTYTVKVNQTFETANPDTSVADDLNKIEAVTEFANGAVEDDAEATEGESDEATNKTYNVEVKFTDALGHDLGYVITQSFDVADKGFDWLIRVNTDLGVCTFCEDLTVKDESLFKAEPMASEGFNNGIYIQGFAGLATWEGGTDIKVNAVINVTKYYYTIIAKYQDLTTSTAYDNYVVTKQAELTTSFPNDDEVAYFKNGGEIINPSTGETKYGPGWKLQNYETRNVANVDQPKEGESEYGKGVTVTLTLDRNYGLLSFDLGSEGEPQNCPDKVYMKNGQPYSDIATWKRSDAVYLPPNPDRVPYKFTGWQYHVPGQTKAIEMPTDTWKNLKAPGEDRVFEAIWTLPEGVEKTRVTLAYWCERANSTSEKDCEYVIERYDNVDLELVGKPYKLPEDESQRYSDPMKYRKYPQKRASSSDEITVTSEFEDVPNSKDRKNDSYDFGELYDYVDYDRDVIIKEDGSTVVKVYLKRKAFKLTYTWNNGQMSINKKWDADIAQDFMDICEAACGSKGRYVSWVSTTTNYQTVYITNMPKFNESFTYDETFPTSSDTPIRYYIQKLGKPANLDKNWDRAAESTSYSANWELLVSIPAQYRFTTSDEYIPMLGFDTPTQNVTGPPWRSGSGEGALGGSLSFFYYNHIGDWYWDPHGLSYYYVRHTNELYLRNIHGVTDVNPATNKPYHYDYCVSVGCHYDGTENTGVGYQLPIGQFTFLANEKSEEKKGVYSSTGQTGIRANETLKYFTENRIQPPSDLEHYYFAGWYTDPAYAEGTEVNLDTWTMPDHEQDIYAKWEAPKRQVRFNTVKDVTKNLDENIGEPNDCVYDTLVNPEDVPKVIEPKGYHFTSWYYFKTAEDKAAGKKTWFDPYTMELPWVTWDEYPQANDDSAVLTLHQEWSESKEVDYEWHFKLGSTDGEEIAPTIYGRANAGSEVSYDTTDKPVSDFYSGYGGFVKADPATHSYTLDWDSANNSYTFIFNWDSDAKYHVRVEYWAYNKGSDTKIAYMGSREGGSRTETTGWSEAEANQFKYPYTPIPGGDIDPKYKDYTLLSASRITTTLTPDKEAKEGEIFPYANIIEVYYAPGGTVDFTYNVKTYTDSTHETLAPANTNGGYILDDDGKHAQHYEQAGVGVYLGVGTATAGLNPACKFDGWYSTKIDDNVRVLDTKVSDEYIQYDPTLNQWKLTCPKTDSLYLNDAEYWAVFTYDDNNGDGFDINYKVKVLDGKGNPVNVAGVELKVGEAGSQGAEIKQTLANPFATVTNVNIAKQLSYYPYSEWQYSSGSEVPDTPATGEPFATPKAHFQDVDGTDYYYYVPETYSCVFDETKNPAAAITYKVDTGFTEFGEVVLNKDGSEAGSSTSESIYPYIGNKEIGTTAKPAVYGATASVKSTSAVEYKFTGWTKENSTEVISTDAKYVPNKVNNVYSAATYVAHFVRQEVSVSWATDGHGTIEPNTTATIVLVNTTFTIDQSTGAVSFLEPGKTVADKIHTPKGNNGYIFDKWTYGESTEITSQTITANVTLTAHFKSDSSLYAVYKVADADLDKGYLVKDEDAAKDEHNQTIYRQGVNSLTGDPNKVTAKGLEGYEFDYWSEIIDGEDTKLVGADAEHFTLPPTSTTPYTYYETGRTFYAHFKTYNVTVDIIVNPAQSTWGKITDETGSAAFTQLTVTTQTPYSIGTDSTSGRMQGQFNLDRTLKAIAMQGADNGWEFASWTMYDKNGTTVIGLPADSDKIIKRNTTFIANFRKIGNKPYEIHYYYQKLDSTRTGVVNDYDTLSKLPLSDPAHRKLVQEDPDVEYGDIINQTAAPLATIDIPLSDVTGFKNSHDVVRYVPSSGTTVNNGVWTLDGGSGAVRLDVYLDRMTDFPYRLQHMIETADSARLNKDNPKQIDFNNRDYEGTYTQYLDWSQMGTHTQVPLTGIYGAIAYVYENPWESKDIKYVYDYPVNEEEDSTLDNWKPKLTLVDTPHYVGGTTPVKTESLSNKEYIIGSGEGSTSEYGLCTLYANRATNYPFVVKYYQQNIDDDKYPTEPTVMVTGLGLDTDPVETEDTPFKQANFQGINDSKIKFTTTDGEGNKTLEAKFDISQWDMQVPGKAEGVTYESLFTGFTFYGTDQVNDELLNSSYTTGETYGMFKYPVCNVYFSRDNDTPYTINYHRESVASAEARAKTPGTIPVWGDAGEVVVKDDTLKGRTGKKYSLSGEVYKNKYSAEGFAWYEGTGVSPDVKSATEVTVGPDGKTVVDIYYIRDINVSFTVMYYNEKVSPEGQYEDTPFKTTSLFGVLGSTVYTDSKATHPVQPTWLTDDIRIDETGFTFNPSKSEPATSAVIGYGTVIKLYYDRNTTTKWTIEYYQQKLNATSTDVVDDYAKVSTDTKELTNGRTGTDKDFTDYITGEKAKSYDYFTLDHVTIGVLASYPGAVVVSPNYKINVNAEGNSVVRIFYKRDLIPYKADHLLQQLNEGHTVPSDPPVYAKAGNSVTGEGYLGTIVPLNFASFVGYAPNTTQTEPKDLKLELGTHMEEVEGTMTSVAKLYYDLDEANKAKYTVTVKYESLEEAIARRDFGTPSVYSLSVKKTQDAYPGQWIEVSNWVDSITKGLDPDWQDYHFDAYKCAAYEPSTSEYYQVNDDANGGIVIYLQRKTDLHVNVDLIQEQLDYAKGLGGAKYDKDDTSTVEHKTLNGLIYEEKVDLKETYSDYYTKQKLHFYYDNEWEQQTGTMIVPPTGEITGDVYYERGNDVVFYVGYRIETIEHAKHHDVPPVESDFDKYKGVDWIGYANGIEGDTAKEDSLRPDESGKSFKDYVTEEGYNYWFKLPENGIYITGAADSDIQLSLYYERAQNYSYTIKAYKETLDWAKHVEGAEHWESAGIDAKTVNNQIYELPVNQSTKEVDDFIDKAKEQLVGFTFDSESSTQELIVKEDCGDFEIMFTRNRDNVVTIKHYGQTLANAWARIDNPGLPIEYDRVNVIPETTEIISGSEENPLITGDTYTPISTHHKTYNPASEADKKLKWYGFDYKEVDPVTDSIEITGVADYNVGACLYERHLWTIAPYPELDPDIPDPFTPVTPDSFKVPEGWEVVIESDTEKYIYPDPIEPFLAHGDAEVPVPYHEKNVQIYYMVNDAALGSVDPEENTYKVITGNPIGSSATSSGASTFLNWTNEAGEVVSTDANYIPEKVPVDEPEEENGFKVKAAANEDPTIYGEPFVYTANFQAGTVATEGGQTSDNVNLLAIFALISVALVGAFVFMRRSRGTNKCVNSAKHVR